MALTIRDCHLSFVSSGVQARVKKNKFLKYAENTIVKNLPISQCRKIPEGIRLDSKTTFSPTGKKTILKIHFSKDFVVKSLNAEKEASSSAKAFCSRKHPSQTSPPGQEIGVNL